jgi:UDP-N-acetylglucosamine 2-epimerase (non-hydrolysing)
MRRVLQKENVVCRLKKEKEKNIFIVVVATKPDIIKQASLYKELKKQNMSVLLVHTGQHYDFNLSGGMLEEFQMTIDVNLHVSGKLYEKTAQIISRFGNLLEIVKEIGKNPVPIVHGDTTTASAVANASWANQIAVIHNEAGIRTLTPKKEFFKKLLQEKNIEQWFSTMEQKKNFETSSIEPIPEQFNTRSIEAATGIFLAPHTINKQFLQAEGFPPERVFVVGNSVIDVVTDNLKKANTSNIFREYPLLKNPFIRFCIHRRENCQNRKRFTHIFEAMENMVNEGYIVLLISLFSTDAAIKEFGFTRRLENLKQKENFIYSSVWPFYNDVVAAMKNALVCVTDSGSMQEEMNEMGIPCVTLRFGTDRPETLFAKTNVLAPPISSEIICKIIQKVIQDKPFKKGTKIYGESPSQKSVAVIQDVLKNSDTIFYDEDARVLKQIQ